jgi:tetratricopeptide (TPR) repeat protein
MQDPEEMEKSSSGPAALPLSRPNSEFVKASIVCVLLAIIVWVAFGQMRRHEFNYDDAEYIKENVHVLRGLNWPDLRWAFTTGYPGYAIPVTWLSHQLDCQLYGVWAGGHHLTSVALHTVSSLLLFLFFWRMTRDLWPSAFVAALFAIHPLHVESVAWAAERKDVLSGLFFFLTLHAYAAYAAKPQVWRYVLTLFLFILGILSKPMLVTVPCLLLLLDYWPLRRLTFSASKPDPTSSLSLGWLVLEKIPFALVAGSWSLLTFLLLKETGSVAEAQLGIPFRIANALFSYAIYMWQTFWPHDLALPYPRALRSGTVVVSVALLALVSVLCIAKKGSSPCFIVGWFWFLGMLVPVIGFIPPGEQARADRYTYLPQIGLCLLVAWGAMELFAKWRRGRQAMAVVILLTITGLTALSYRQASYWQDSETLWNHSLAVTSHNQLAHNNLGNALMHKKGRLDEAIVQFQKALEIRPDYPDANNNLGYALASKGRYVEAMGLFRTTLRVRPSYAKAHNNLAITLAQLGKTNEAIEQFNQALEIDGNYADGHYNFGIVLLRLGRREEAIAHLNEALRLKPDDTELRAQLHHLGVER